MNRTFYSTGQAARELDTTQARIRALCDAGAIQAQRTPGRQWRIPVDEVNRLRQAGLPELPRELPTDLVPVRRPEQSHPNLLAEPSADAIHAADEVVQLENEVQAISFARQREEGLDWFRDRERHQEKLEAEEKARQETAEAEIRHRDWESGWIDHGLALVPDATPHQIKLDVHRAVRAALVGEGPASPASVMEQLVEAVVEKAVQPWRQQQQIETIIQEAADCLPWGAKRISEPTPWQVRVMQLAAERIAELRNGASLPEVRAAAKSATEQVTREFEHAEAVDKMVRETWFCLSGATPEEVEDAEAAVRRVLEALKPGESQREMKKVRDTALTPFRTAIARRDEQETRERIVSWAGLSLPFGLSVAQREAALEEIREALDKVPEGASQGALEQARDQVVGRYREIQDREERKERLIRDALASISSYITDLKREWEIDEGVWTLEQEIKAPIRKQLEKELRGSEPEEQVRNRVRRLVRQQLGID